MDWKYPSDVVLNPVSVVARRNSFRSFAALGSLEIIRRGLVSRIRWYMTIHWIYMPLARILRECRSSFDTDPAVWSSLYKKERIRLTTHGKEGFILSEDLFQTTEYGSIRQRKHHSDIYTSTQSSSICCLSGGNSCLFIEEFSGVLMVGARTFARRNCSWRNWINSRRNFTDARE